ncbi:hypothetical protein [Gordonia aichiensis]|uniref:hypothetical protein n=1 Tax=Gordonia aichiensis TaxID=36820 RepID=UPI0032640AB7
MKGSHTTRGFELDLNQGLDRVEASHGAPSIVDLGAPGQWSIPLRRDLVSFRIDCRSDVDVLRSALTDVAGALRHTGASVPQEISTRKAVNEAVETVSRGAFDATKAHRLVRAQEILKTWDKGHVQAREISDVVTKLPSVAEEVLRIETEATTAATQQAQAEWTQQNAEAQAELEAARAEHGALQAESAVLRSELEQTEDIVRQRLAELSENASSLLAENVIARALTPQHHVPSPSTIRRTTPVFTTPSRECKTVSAQTLNKVAGNDPIVAETLTRIHAAHCAGLLPIVIGADAQLALATYARVVVADRIAFLPVAHDFLHPVDLLGVRAETGQLSRPHGDLLRVANDEVGRQTPGLLVLEGFNRGATESYLVPWLTRMDQSITLGESASAAFQTDTFTRSPDLLLAATAINGSTTAPVGPDLWGRAVVIDVRHWTIFDIADIAPTWISPRVGRSPEADEVATEVLRSVMATVNPWWHVDSSILNAIKSYARSLAANAEILAGDTTHIRTTIAECILLPSLATALSREELASAVESLIKWVAPKDKGLQARLNRRADRIIQVLS